MVLLVLETGGQWSKHTDGLTQGHLRMMFIVLCRDQALLLSMEDEDEEMNTPGVCAHATVPNP